ncbi:nucleoside triphosphate pyrophosphohydrolase [Pseudomonas sp. F1_0610]|uniref:nucleoside triphosphate pyrophosphohydrolase n=1 Tax=Pseudomonas sp. F1_0610 TaxID=3114284 RepID=UPI0039C141F7
MQRLRDPEHGCPWDIEQSFASIVPHTLEEVYEVVDAIEREDFAHLPSELGDLLFQVVYYAQLGKEQHNFDFSSIVDNITRKLIRRHPHVFPDGDLYGSTGVPRLAESAIKQRWEEIKAQERAEQSTQPEQLSLLDDVPNALPSMTRAIKLQKRAASVGFDWQQTEPIFAKLAEETQELQEAIASGVYTDMQAELGDLLFVVTNLARHLKIDPDQALRQTNQKFERRFRFIEQHMQAAGKALQSATLEELDALWDQAKLQENKA